MGRDGLGDRRRRKESVLSIRVGIVTVTYRGGDRPLEWAEALGRAIEDARGLVDVEVIAVDNASGDGTAERLRQAAPWIEVVEQLRNNGFAAGCNAGIRRLNAPDVVMLVNPDVRLDRAVLRTVAALPWPADLAARGPLVYGREGAVEQSARGFPRAATAVFGRTSLLARLRPRARTTRRELRADPATGATAVDWVSGACLITTATALDVVGEFDEGYFMYWEDADWCRRAADRGLRVLYEPCLVVHHDQGSSAATRRARAIITFHRSALRYWRLHVARSSWSTAVAALALGLRCAVKLLALGLRLLVSSGTRRHAES